MNEALSKDEMWELIRQHCDAAVRLGRTRDGEDESLKDERLAAALELAKVETKLHRIIFRKES